MPGKREDMCFNDSISFANEGAGMNIAFFLNRFLEMEKECRKIADNFVDAEGNNLWLFMRTLFNGYITERGRLKLPPYSFRQSEWTLIPSFIKALSKLRKGGCLLSSCMEVHTEKLGGKLFDPYLDPVAWEVRRMGMLPIKTVFNFTAGYKDAEFAVPPLPLTWACLGMKEWRFSGPSAIKSYPGYEKASLEFGLPAVPWQNILSYYLGVSSMAGLWKQILSILKPRMAVLECYYNERNMGLAMACRALGIPCIEYQHGLQTWPHVAYNFLCMPPHGYDAVPEWFFLWGERSARNINRYFSQQDYHKSVVAGKPAYTAWTQDTGGEQQKYEARLDAVTQGRIPVCVALPVGEAEQYALLEAAVSQAPADWIWLLRRHPVNGSPLASGLDLAARFPERSERELSSAMSLHSLLQHCRHLVTGYSSTVLEATALHGMSATCIDAQARYYLRENIERGEARFADSVDSLLSSISRGISEYPCQYGHASEISKNKDQMFLAFKHVVAYETAISKNVGG